MNLRLRVNPQQVRVQLKVRFLELNLRFLFSSPFEGDQPLVPCFAELLGGIELRHQWPIHDSFIVSRV